MSVYSTKASSELDFDFDDVVIDSAVYRRVLAAAKQQANTVKRDGLSEDLVGIIGSDLASQDDTFVAHPVNSRQSSRHFAHTQTAKRDKLDKTLDGNTVSAPTGHGDVVVTTPVLSSQLFWHSRTKQPQKTASPERYPRPRP
jgi:hypothetical protein